MPLAAKTSRPHIHIREPEVRCAHTVEGDVSQHVDRVGLRAFTKVSDNIQPRRNHERFHHALVDIGSLSVQKESDREWTTGDRWNEKQPRPTLKPERKEVDALKTTPYAPPLSPPRLGHDREVVLLL